MTENRAGSLIGGVVLIGLGLLFLLFQFVPGATDWLQVDRFWPLIIVGVGAALLIVAVVGRIPPLAIPGCIVGGIGCLLFVQNATGYWESWSFAWALIPGFVGLGLIISGLLSGNVGDPIRRGLGLLVVSAVLFIIFAAFLGPFGSLARFWPVLLIVAGVLVLGRTLLARR
jgi:hypothetical protein